MAIPDETGPDETGPDNHDGPPRDPGRVSDADWRRVVEDLVGSAEARGTRDSLMQQVRPVPRPGPVEYVPASSAPGWFGAGALASAAASCRRVLAGIDRWLRKPPAALTLPAGSQARFTIGREPACDMTLLDRTVSRWHACLKREDDGWLLTDLGSTNGTRLNGWRVNAPITVSPGDLVSFGAATFVLTERPGQLR